MLPIDLNGRIKNPTQRGKKFGGDIDARGVPFGVEIPTAGNYAGVTVSDRSGDIYYAKSLSRTTNGLACVRGDFEIDVSGDMQAFNVTAAIFGGASGATSGQTRRDFKIGFISDDGSEGCFYEYRNENTAPGESGHYITRINNGVITRTRVFMAVNSPTDRYEPGLWLSKHPAGGWTATLLGKGKVHTEMHIPAAEIEMNNVRPIAEWNWNHPSGSFGANVATFEYEIYWRY